MKIVTALFLFVVFGCTLRETVGTCVLESDFGFTLNCAFKKSGLFRVRNLGGVKGYVGLGFSVGDELGFRESLSNLESSRRRSVQAGRGNTIPIGSSNMDRTNRNDARKITQGSRIVPPFKPLPPGLSRPMAQQSEHQRLVVQQNSTALRTVPAPSFAAMQREGLRQQQRLEQEENMRQQQRIQQEAFAMQIMKQQQEAARQQQLQKFAAQQQNAQQQMLAMHTNGMQLAPGMESPPAKLPNIIAAIPPAGSVVNSEIAQPLPKILTGVLTTDSGLPPFIAIPNSTAQLADRISNSPTLLEDAANEVAKDDFNQLPIPSNEAISTVNQLTLRSVQPAAVAQMLQSLPQQQADKQTMMSSSPPSLSLIQSMEPSLKTLAEASNVTLEALETAILLRQQQLMQKYQRPTTTTTTTTTQAPVKKYNFAEPTKVMNAPREYYPVGYDKNFDDNFASRVDLPDTSFYCGDQKHFPGLYADEDLGCMVFHICALTDDGLIMKSFLCPESTLFDQTILKCNWWFYVDCKLSKSLYDSNIPISKSYQLMKALAFFSAYKNHDNSSAEEVGDEGS